MDADPEEVVRGKVLYCRSLAMRAALHMRVGSVIWIFGREG